MKRSVCWLLTFLLLAFCASGALTVPAWAETVTDTLPDDELPPADSSAGVVPELKGIVLSSQSAFHHKADWGKKFTLEVSFEPANAFAQVSWSSSDESVVTVTSLDNGACSYQVMGSGQAVLTASAAGFTASCAVEVDAFGAPVVKATNVASTGKVKLTWNKVDNAVKYQVYRAEKGSDDFKLMYTTSKTSYTNTNAKAGTSYTYKVRAVAADGVKSVFSKTVTRACDLERVTVKATNSAATGKIKLSWNKVEGAVKYEVYRAVKGSDEYKLVYTTTKTSYTNTNAKAGTSYSYKVKAICENSAANSAYSKVVTRACDLARPNVKISLSAKGDPKLTWSKVEGAVSYKVYRATSKDGTYKLMYTTSKTSYTNTSAKAGVTYYYKVVAVSSNSAANSAYSLVDSIKAK